jgi:hypothetical protein
MYKPSENRSNSLAENKKSNQNPHLSDEQLLLSLDGELSAPEAAQVEVHVASCWACRARREQIEKVIGDVVDYRDQLIQPYFSVSTGGRSRFVYQLEQLAARIGQPPLWKRAMRAARGLWAISQIGVPRYVWIGAPVVATLAFFSFTRLWQVTKVSASELLENAQSSEVLALRSVTKPVLYQKLRIRTGSRTVTRTIYRDPVGVRQADRLDLVEGAGEMISSNAGMRKRPQDQPDAVHTADAEIQRTFFAAHLSWKDPLSPANYSTWYKSLDDRQSEVVATGEDSITLRTVTSEGPIAEASITVRSTDFHPVAEDLRLQDGRQVEIHELAWDVLPMDSINVAIFEPEPTPYEAVSKRPATMALQPPGPTDAELAEDELRVLVAIHAEKADLGEQIELDRDISRSVQRSVIVRGIVSTPERKSDLLTALQGIPHVELRLQTIEEVQSQQNQAPSEIRLDAAPQAAREVSAQEDEIAGGNSEATRLEPPAIFIAGRPAFEQQLEQHFPVAEARAAFVNQTVELVQDAMAQAWALRRLGNRYAPNIITELSVGSQQTLALLIRDHVSVLRQDVDEVRVRVSPLLSPALTSAVSTPPSDVPLSAGATASDWRARVMSVFSETQKINDDASALLAGTGETLSDPQAAVRELQQALVALETQLPALYQQVSEPFWNEPKNSDR